MRDELVFSCVIKTKDALFCLQKRHNIICKVCFCFSAHKMVSIHLWSTVRLIHMHMILLLRDAFYYKCAAVHCYKIFHKFSRAVHNKLIKKTKTIILNIIYQAIVNKKRSKPDTHHVSLSFRSLQSRNSALKLISIPHFWILILYFVILILMTIAGI